MKTVETNIQVANNSHVILWNVLFFIFYNLFFRIVDYYFVTYEYRGVLSIASFFIHFLVLAGINIDPPARFRSVPKKIWGKAALIILLLGMALMMIPLFGYGFL